MRRSFAVVVIAILGFVAGARAQSGGPMLFRQPTMNQTHVVFVFADDLWSVARSGGAAVRLTSNVGSESNPAFSPDGQWVA